MIEAEGGQIQDLLRGRKTQHFSWPKFYLTAGLSLLIFAAIGVECILSDDVEALLNVALGLVCVFGALGVAVIHQMKSRAALTKLRNERVGVFTELAGRIHESGIDYLVGDYPIRYLWEDFVGYRSGEKTVVLYLDYPTEVNFLAESLFDEGTGWQDAKMAIEQNVPRLKRFAKLTARRKNPVMSGIAAGITALNDQDWTRALAKFDRVLELRPGDPQALQGRMVSAVGIQDVDLSLEAIARVVELGAPDATTRRLRASTLIAAERYGEALDDLDWLVERVEKADCDLLRDRGLALLKLGRLEEALNSTSEAIAVCPTDAIAFNNRGVTLLQLDRFEEAIVALEKAIDLDPAFERPRQHLAEATSLIAAGATS